jgi:hydrogenase nickel insertion protein HypA
MHEYAIVSALFDQIEAHAKGAHAAGVTRVTVALGEMSGVDRGLFETAFGVFRARTICAGAELSVRSVPAAWVCPRCKAELAPGAPLRCMRCNAPAKLARGDEIVLERIEMEVSDV